MKYAIHVLAAVLLLSGTVQASAMSLDTFAGAWKTPRNADFTPIGRRTAFTVAGNDYQADGTPVIPFSVMSQADQKKYAPALLKFRIDVTPDEIDKYGPGQATIRVTAYTIEKDSKGRRILVWQTANTFAGELDSSNRPIVSYLVRVGPDPTVMFRDYVVSVLLVDGTGLPHPIVGLPAEGTPVTSFRVRVLRQ